MKETIGVPQELSPCGLPVVHYSLSDPLARDAARAAYEIVTRGFTDQMWFDRCSVPCMKDGLMQFIFGQGNLGFVTILYHNAAPVASCEVLYGNDESGKENWGFGLEVIREMHRKKTGFGYNVLAAAYQHLLSIEPVELAGIVDSINVPMVGFVEQLRRHVSDCRLIHTKGSGEGGGNQNAILIPPCAVLDLQKFASSFARTYPHQ